MTACSSGISDVDMVIVLCPMILRATIFCAGRRLSAVFELCLPRGGQKNIPLTLLHGSTTDSAVHYYVKLQETYLGNIAATSLSVFCLSTSSSSVLSRIRSSRLEEYCSNMRSMLSMMLVFLPLVMFLNYNKERMLLKLISTKEAPQRSGLSVLSPV